MGIQKTEDALEAFEELGVKFDADDKEEFLDGNYGFIIGSSGSHAYEIETDDANEVIERIKAKLKV